MTTIYEHPALNTSAITTSLFDKFSSLTIKEHKTDVFDRLPTDLVEEALTLLSQQNIPLIPWGSLLYRSLNVPQYLLHFYFFIPDELLDLASDTVSAMHLPLSPPPPLLAYMEGDLVTEGRLHRLTRSTAQEDAQYLNLLPLSFGGFLPSELNEQRFNTYNLFVPRQSAVYACILRIIATYPRSNSPVRGSLTAELELLINYNLLKLPLGYRTPDDDNGGADDDDDEDDDEGQGLSDLNERVEKAVCTVRNWGAVGEWRDGEEWMQDTLIAIIRGSGDIDYLPWSTR